MIRTLLTRDWNAEPNDPEVKILIDNTTVRLDFYLNYILYSAFHEEDKASVTFCNCHKYSFNTMNDEGYFKGDYRYSNFHLPWGEFYILDTDWQTDFPSDPVVLNNKVKEDKINHYIFFFRDNTFECVAESYSVEFIRRTATTRIKQ